MMDRYGFPIFLGWAASSLVLRLGGLRAHRGLRPAAFGLYRPMDGVWVIE